MKATAYHKYLYQQGEGDVSKITNILHGQIYWSNPVAFELLDATGDTSYNHNTFVKAAELVVKLCKT